MSEGITTRRTASGSLRYRAEAWDNAAGRRVYRTFPTKTAARNWRRDMQIKIKSGEVRASTPLTVSDAWSQWLPLARADVIRTRGGAVYKPGVLRSYELSFDGRLRASLGRVKVGELRRVHVQRFVDRLVAEGLAAQTIRNTVTALRVLMKWCIREELIGLNPCDGVELPSGGASRDRIASPSEALDLVQALPTPTDRALMATAFFAGLRRGELMALRWACVDLAARTITVDAERGNYDTKTHAFTAPKSKKGARTLGIPELLVPWLHQLFVDERGWPEPFHVGALVFPGARGGVFSDQALADRCKDAWNAAELERITLHEARHTYASIMIAAGVNIKTISEWMGHSSVTITLDRYGHLLPGSAAEALGLLNGYLEREITHAA